MFSGHRRTSSDEKKCRENPGLCCTMDDSELYEPISTTEAKSYVLSKKLRVRLVQINLREKSLHDLYQAEHITRGSGRKVCSPRSPTQAIKPSMSVQWLLSDQMLALRLTVLSVAADIGMFAMCRVHTGDARSVSSRPWLPPPGVRIHHVFRKLWLLLVELMERYTHRRSGRSILLIVLLPPIAKLCLDSSALARHFRHVPFSPTYERELSDQRAWSTIRASVSESWLNAVGKLRSSSPVFSLAATLSVAAPTAMKPWSAGLLGLAQIVEVLVPSLPRAIVLRSRYRHRRLDCPLFLVHPPSLSPPLVCLPARCGPWRSCYCGELLVCGVPT
jgi:hypothetical protein